MSTRRLSSLDIMRGVAIMVIVVIHRIHYHWTGMADRAALHRHVKGPWAPLIIGTIVLFTMAGLFYLISGLVNAYAVYGRAGSAGEPPGRLMRGGIVAGLWLICCNYLHRLFFMNGFVAAGGAEPEYPAGLLTGFLRGEGPAVFRWSQLTEPGTLSLIGLVLVAVSLTMGLLLRRGIPDDAKRIYRVLGWAGAISLALSPFAKYLLMPLYQNAYTAGNYALAWLLGHFCQEFGVFPYLGYGFFGAMTGIALARGENLKEIRRRNRRIIPILLVLGALGVVLADRHDPLGERIIGASISYIELAVFLYLTGWALKTWDLGPKASRNHGGFRIARRFGMVALTVYACEPIMAGLLKKGVDAVFGVAWSANLPLVLTFGFFCLIVWWGVLVLWEKAKFAGSIEHLSALLLRKLTGRYSGKTRFEALRPPV